MSNRRYKVGLNPIYDNAFDRASMMSVLLNPSKATFDDAYIVDALNDKKGVEGLLLQWKGNSEKEYTQNNKIYPSKLLKAEQLLELIKLEFKAVQQIQINSGKKPSEEMPVDLKEKMLKAEAQFDVVNAEIKALERKLAEFNKQQEKIISKAILKGGPRGHGKIRGGVLVEIDGQTVVQDSKGVLRIWEPTSPYNRMAVHEYHETIVKPFGRQWEKEQAELRREKQLAFKQGLATATA